MALSATMSVETQASSAGARNTPPRGSSMDAEQVATHMQHGAKQRWTKATAMTMAIAAAAAMTMAIAVARVVAAVVAVAAEIVVAAATTTNNVTIRQSQRIRHPY